MRFRMARFTYIIVDRMRRIPTLYVVKLLLKFPTKKAGLIDWQKRRKRGVSVLVSSRFVPNAVPKVWRIIKLAFFLRESEREREAKS